MIFILCGGVFVGLLAVQMDRRLGGTLAGKVMLEQMPMAGMVAVVRVLGVPATFACLISGFLLFDWWVPIVVFLGASLAVVPFIFQAQRHMDEAINLLPLLHLAVTATALILWLSWADWITF